MILIGATLYRKAALELQVLQVEPGGRGYRGVKYRGKRDSVLWEAVVMGMYIVGRLKSTGFDQAVSKDKHRYLDMS